MSVYGIEPFPVAFDPCREVVYRFGVSPSLVLASDTIGTRLFVHFSDGSLPINLSAAARHPRGYSRQRSPRIKGYRVAIAQGPRGKCGLLMGSFLNVCIVRLPAGESIMWPRSHCRQCKQPIANRDNIPLLSYLLLGAKCRACGSRISWRYPVIELATCVLFVMCCLSFSPGRLAACWA